MNCLIGILHCGESQYDACRAAIASQSHKNWDVFVVKDLPNVQAHQVLFKTFADNADQFDLFVKVDADMELYHEDFLKELTHFFATESDIDYLAMKVDDFFTARFIWGLNAFRSSVVFAEIDEVYTDKAAQVEQNRRARLKRHKTLVPAARHGFDPTDYHAFYFGCHKAVTVMHRQSRSHMRNIRRLPWAALQRWDRRPLLAYAGAAIAFERQMLPAELDHDSGKVRVLFDDLMRSKGNVGLLQSWRYRSAVVKAGFEYLG